LVTLRLTTNRQLNPICLFKIEPFIPVHFQNPKPRFTYLPALLTSWLAMETFALALPKTKGGSAQGGDDDNDDQAGSAPFAQYGFFLSSSSKQQQQTTTTPITNDIGIRSRFLPGTDVVPVPASNNGMNHLHNSAISAAEQKPKNERLQIGEKSKRASGDYSKRRDGYGGGLRSTRGSTGYYDQGFGGARATLEQTTQFPASLPILHPYNRLHLCSSHSRSGKGFALGTKEVVWQVMPERIPIRT
jgi:hypothetical protein